MINLTKDKREEIMEEYDLSIQDLNNRIKITENIFGSDVNNLIDCIENWNDICVWEELSYDSFINHYIMDNMGESFPSWFIGGNIGWKEIFDNSDLRYQFYMEDGVGFINSDYH